MAILSLADARGAAQAVYGHELRAKSAEVVLDEKVASVGLD